jgi:hypothetical protein
MEPTSAKSTDVKLERLEGLLKDLVKIYSPTGKLERGSHVSYSSGS